MTTAYAVAAGAIFGLIVGSFLATIAIRWPQGLSIVAGRSRCDACGHVLGVAELVPLASWALLRGQCARCHTRINALHPRVEVAAAAVGAAALAVSPDLAGLAGASFGWGLLLLAILDLRHQWLPDRVTIPLAAGGLAASMMTATPLEARLLGAAAGFTTLHLVKRAYRLSRGREGLGGGDPKLFAAIGAWLGWASLPMVLFLASSLGLVVVLVVRAGGAKVDRATRLPFGALLAPAAFVVWLVTQ